MKKRSRSSSRVSGWGSGGVALLLVLAWQPLARGHPRPPWPPLPEVAGPVLFHEGFDWAWGCGTTNAAIRLPAYGTLTESWSGFALQRCGPVSPFVVPALDTGGGLNVPSHTDGAVRLWLTPAWTSASLGGTGPGKEATLMALVAADGREAATVWALSVTADGSVLRLLAGSEAGPVELLKAEIAWPDGCARCVALNFGPAGTALFVDGQLVAKGLGTLAVPPKAALLVLGSSLAGTDSVEADLDEIDALGRPLTEEAVAWYYRLRAKQAALGPISDAEWAAQHQALERLKAERATAWAARLESSPETLLALGPTSRCLTNGPVHLTNVLCRFEPGLGWTVTFDLQGGTNGLLYDIFTATNLCGNAVAESQWTWLERGPTCTTYQYVNQPPRGAFFLLGTPQDSDADGLTDA